MMQSSGRLAFRSIGGEARRRKIPSNRDLRAGTFFLFFPLYFLAFRFQSYFLNNL
jgi:hypothetical protein